MNTINVYQAKTTLSKLLEQIETGQEKEIVIARHGRPVALLSQLPTRKPGKRIGVAKGRFVVPDSIDADSAKVARLFRGEPA